MAVLGSPYDPDVIRALVDRQAALERRVADLEGRRLLAVSRGASTSDVVDPVEGQLLVTGAALNYYADGSWRSGSGEFEIKVFADSEVNTVVDGRFIFAIPSDLDGTSLVDAQAYVTTVATGGTLVTVQIRNVTDAADMLSTRITIDASEFTSYTAATPRVINAANAEVATGDRVAIDVDAVGSTTPGQGLGVILRFN